MDNDSRKITRAQQELARIMRAQYFWRRKHTRNAQNEAEAHLVAGALDDEACAGDPNGGCALCKPQATDRTHSRAEVGGDGVFVTGGHAAVTLWGSGHTPHALPHTPARKHVSEINPPKSKHRQQRTDRSVGQGITPGIAGTGGVRAKRTGIGMLRP